MAKNIDEQKPNVLPLNFSELTEQAEEEGELEDEWDEQEEDPLTPEEVLAAFRIISKTIQEIDEDADWAPWHYWTEEQIKKLVDYVNGINWHLGTVKTVLQICGIEVDE